MEQNQHACVSVLTIIYAPEEGLHAYNILLFHVLLDTILSACCSCVYESCSISKQKATLLYGTSFLIM